VRQDALVAGGIRSWRRHWACPHGPETAFLHIGHCPYCQSASSRFVGAQEGGKFCRWSTCFGGDGTLGFVLNIRQKPANADGLAPQTATRPDLRDAKPAVWRQARSVGPWFIAGPEHECAPDGVRRPLSIWPAIIWACFASKLARACDHRQRAIHSPITTIFPTVTGHFVYLFFRIEGVSDSMRYMARKRSEMSKFVFSNLRGYVGRIAMRQGGTRNSQIAHLTRASVRALFICVSDA